DGHHLHQHEPLPPASGGQTKRPAIPALLSGGERRAYALGIPEGAVAASSDENGGSDPMNEVTVRVPAKPELVQVLRSVIASVAARAEFSYDEIEDLRLAVDEATASLLSHRTPGAAITMRIDDLQGGLEILVSIDGEPTSWPPTGSGPALAGQILTA